MKKSAKLAMTLALSFAAVPAVYTFAPPQEASAEISDKFRMEINGVTSYVMNKHALGGYAKTNKSGDLLNGYWNSYTRLALTYYADKNVTFHGRLHSGYDNLGNDFAETNTKGAYFDQSWLDFKDKKANVTYSIGKLGAVLGQTMIYNSTGNHTGAKISIGNWYDPQSLQLWYVNKTSGQRMFAVQASKELVKNFQMTATYLSHNTTSNGKTYTQIRDWDVGFKAKLPAFTVVGEYAKNIARSNRVYYKARNTDKRAFFIEVYTGPTNDMTSGLPLQKPGTSVWSLKYQDIGSNAVGSHNTTFYDDARGWRLNYGHTFRKGLAGDISIARMQDKGGNASSDPDNGKWKTAVVAEISYKFR